MLIVLEGAGVISVGSDGLSISTSSLSMVDISILSESLDTLSCLFL